MEEKILDLYMKIAKICLEYHFYKNRNLIEQLQELLPEVEEFTGWFLGGNKLEIEPDIYEYMKGKWVEILADCMDGIKRRDVVYLHDALDYGMREFLKLFIPEEKLASEDEENGKAGDR